MKFKKKKLKLGMLAGNVDTAVKKIADLKDQQKVSTL